MTALPNRVQYAWSNITTTNSTRSVLLNQDGHAFICIFFLKHDLILATRQNELWAPHVCLTQHSYKNRLILDVAGIQRSLKPLSARIIFQPQYGIGFAAL